MDSYLTTLFTAYENLHSMMENRGYQLLQGHEKVDRADFQALTRIWETNTEDSWIKAEDTDGNIVTAIFPGKVEVAMSKKIVAYAQSEDNEKAGHVIVVTDEITDQAAKVFSPFRRKPFTRERYIRSVLIETFTVGQMMINPLLGSRQPRFIRLITDSDEKEGIRTALLARAEDKTKPLEDLLAVIFFEKQLSVWFGAFVGDVFYFIRNDGTPYLRIVKPDIQVEKLKKEKSEAGVEEDAE